MVLWSTQSDDVELVYQGMVFGEVWEHEVEMANGLPVYMYRHPRICRVVTTKRGIGQPHTQTPTSYIR